MSSGSTSARTNSPIQSSRAWNSGSVSNSHMRLVSPCLRGEDHGAALDVQAAGHDGDARLGDLAFAAPAAQLEDGLVEEADAVQPALGELAARGVHRQVAAGTDAGPVADP